MDVSSEYNKKSRNHRTMRRSFKEITILPRIKMEIYIILLFSWLTLCLADDGCYFTRSSVSCEQQSGKFLPMETSSEISSLYIIRSDLSALTEEDFKPFKDVDTVSIINSSLLLPKHDRLLSIMSDLSVLRIVHCNVSEGVRAVFADNAQISQLHLSNNKITSLKKEFFSPMKNVEKIDLSHNKISRIEVGTFDRLASLRVLNLNNNYIGVSFETNFLSLQSAICVVCKERFGISKCTSDDFNRCNRSEQEDQLWWISTQVAIDLKENPICGALSRNDSSKEDIHSSTEIYSQEQHSCQVQEQGHCFKHESRRMFFLEACGITNMPPSTFVDQKTDGSVVQADNSILWLSISLLIIGLIVGALITTFLARTGFFADVFSSKSQGDNPKSSNSSYKENEYSIFMEENGVSVQESQEDDHLMPQTEHNIPPRSRQTDNAIETNKDFPFHTAILQGNFEEVSTYLRDKNNYRIKNPLGDCPIHLASRVNDGKTLGFLLKNDEIVDVNIKNNAGETPLTIAARENNMEALNILLQNKADCCLSNFYDVAPLHLASWNGNVEMIRKLLNHGADINKEDTEGKTPLFYASAEAHTEVVELLLKEGANINGTTCMRRLPLHAASWNSNLDIVELLLQYKADVNEKDSRGFTALHNASRKGHTKVMKRLLNCKNVNINAGCKGGNTPLHHALLGGHLQAIQLLLQKGADIKAKNNDGRTALEIAEERRETECVNFLKEYINKAHR